MQEWIVGLIVVFAFVSVLRRYLPRSVRQAVRSSLVRLAERLGWQAMAQKLASPRETGGSCADGCSSCGGCDVASLKNRKRVAAAARDLKRS